MKQIRANQWTLVLAACGIVGLAAVAQADPDQYPVCNFRNQPAATAVAPASQPYGKKANVGFLRRLNEAFMEQMGTPCYTPPDTNAPPSPTRRIGNPPFDSPPYPDGDWQIGGGPNVIGDPGALRDSPYPLMQAIYDGPNGKSWYDSRIQFYGWGTVSGNMSTSHNTGPSPLANYPEVYDERSDRVEFDQFVLYIERMADQNQTDHIDWGFRMACLEGLDYRFMASRGYLNDMNLFWTIRLRVRHPDDVPRYLHSPSCQGHEHHSLGALFRCLTSSNNLPQTTSWPATHLSIVSITTRCGDSGPLRSSTPTGCFNWDWPPVLISRLGLPRIPATRLRAR